VRGNPIMQAPLRRGKTETLGRANGIKRTGRSFLLGFLLVMLVTVSSLAYTWERQLVEQMLKDNLGLENTLDLIQQRTERLSFEVATLSGLGRIGQAASTTLGMSSMDWKDVIVVGTLAGGAK
jgi:cell division protein FtsL